MVMAIPGKLLDQMLSEQHLCQQFYQENSLDIYRASTQHSVFPIQQILCRVYFDGIQQKVMFQRQPPMIWACHGRNQWLPCGGIRDIYCMKILARRRTESELPISNCSVLSVCADPTQLHSLFIVLLHAWNSHTRKVDWMCSCQIKTSGSPKAYTCCIGVRGP